MQQFFFQSDGAGFCGSAGLPGWGAHPDAHSRLPAKGNPERGGGRHASLPDPLAI